MSRKQKNGNDTPTMEADVFKSSEAAAANASNLYSDLAYWQTRSFDMQSEISSLQEQRNKNRIQSLDKIKQKLNAAQ